MESDDPAAMLPEYDVMARGLSAASVKDSPAGLHGVICGLLATGHGRDDAALLATLATHTGRPEGLPGPLADALVCARDSALAGFADTGLELALLLPADEDLLDQRVAALGQWCEGFLVGFGTGAAGVADGDLSPGIQEALSDLAAISQVAIPEQEDEDQQRMLEEVTEHCRMAALMVYTDLVMKPAPATTRPPGKPTRH